MAMDLRLGMSLTKGGGDNVFPVYIMTISQSNMVGVATGTVNRAPNAKIWSGTAWVPLVFDTTGATSTNRGNTTTNIGPECAFAEAAAAYHGKTVYIIKEATGTTSLDSSSDWLATPIANGTKLASALTEIAEALAALTSAGITYEVKGGMSMIGETEAGVSAIVANRHAYNYQNAIKKVRDAAGKPYMRWVIGRPYDNGAAGLTWMTNIRSAEADLCGSGSATIYPDNLTLLDTDAYARTAANVHFTEAGYNSFGTALFNAVKVAPSTISTFKLNQLPFVGPIYRSDVAASLTYDGSNDVSRWNDVSVANWDMAQSGAASAKPNYNSTGYGSIPAITFDGSGTLLSTGTAVGDTSAGSRTVQVGADNKFTMVFVIVPNNLTGTGIVMGKHGAGSGAKGYYVGLDSSEKIAQIAYMNAGGTAYRGQLASAALSNSTRYTVIASYDGSIDTNDGDDRFAMYVNGVAVSHADWINAGTLGDIQTSSYAPLALGGACFSGETSAGSIFKGDIQFAMLFGDTTDATRASQIHAKLAAEFNIT